MNNNLPVGWKKHKLGDVISLEYGKSLPAQDRTGEGFPVMGSNGEVGKHSEFLVEGPGIIVGRKGSHGEVVWVDENFFPIDTTYFVKTTPFIDLKFAFNLLKFLDLKSLNRSTAIPGLNRNDAYGLIIYLPPLAEQKCIVAKLDAAFAHLETLKQGLERIPELLKKFRQTVLSHAVTGKLTEDWREENPVDTTDDLIKRVVEKRYERLSNSYKKNKSLKPENLKIILRKDLDLFSIPESWSWVNLDFLVDETDYFCYGVVQPEDEVESGNKLIRVKDLYNGKVEHDELRTISQEIDVVYKRSKVKEGDILISLVGTIGRTAIVSESESGYNIARALGKIPILDFNSKYVKLFLDSSVAQQWLHGDAREVARKTLNLEQLKSLPVALPPLEEQQEIVTRVEGLLAQAEALEARYRALKAHLDKLPGALLAKAFRGELVPQDPAEVPAPSAPQPLAVAPARRGPGQQQTLGF